MNMIRAFMMIWYLLLEGLHRTTPYIDTNLEKLSKLKPAFPKTGITVAARNSTKFTEGGSGVSLASEDWAAKHNLPVLAYVTYAATGAIEYIENEHDLLLAPVIIAP